MKRFILLFLFVNLTLLCEFSAAAVMPDTVVASVGNSVILKDDFIRSYALAFSVLKRGKDSKKEYLNYMINEIILSDYVQQKKSNPDPAISKSMRLLQQELLVEKIFREEVFNKIVVTEKEITEYNKNQNRKIKAEYYFSPQKNAAEEFRKKIKDGVSFNTLAESKIFLPGVNDDLGETDYITFGGIGEPVNSVLFSLKPDELSDVITAPGGYYVIRIVNEIKNILDPAAPVNKNSSIYKILWNKNGGEMGQNYIKNFMNSKNVVIKAKPFSRLVNLLYPVFKNINKNKNPEKIILLSEYNFGNNDKLKQTIASMKDDVIITAADRNYSASDLFEHFSYRPLLFNTSNINNFADDLKKQIGWVIRDLFLEEEALSRGYNNDEQYKYEFNRWTTKFYSKNLIDSVVSNIDSVQIKESAFYKKNCEDSVVAKFSYERFYNFAKMNAAEAKLLKLVNELKKNYKIEINEKLLTSLEKELADYKYGPDMKLFKLGLPYYREAIPTPEVIWGFNQ